MQEPGAGRVGIPGWVYRVGREGAIPGTQPHCSRSKPDSEAGPVAPARGAEWVVRCSGRTGGRGRSQVPPYGPGRPCWPPCTWDLGNARLLAIGRDLTSYSIKLDKTTKCHQNMSKRPPLVPIFQNGSRKSPLGIPRFPYSQAFSHKELMGHY